MDDAIFIVKRRAGVVPMGLQIMSDHAAFRVAEPSNMEEIHDYAVMRAVLELEPRPAIQSEEPKR